MRPAGEKRPRYAGRCLIAPGTRVSADDGGNRCLRWPAGGLFRWLTVLLLCGMPRRIFIRKTIQRHAQTDSSDLYGDPRCGDCRICKPVRPAGVPPIGGKRLYSRNGGDSAHGIRPWAAPRTCLLLPWRLVRHRNAAERFVCPGQMLPHESRPPEQPGRTFRFFLFPGTRFPSPDRRRHPGLGTPAGGLCRRTTIPTRKAPRHLSPDPIFHLLIFFPLEQGAMPRPLFRRIESRPVEKRQAPQVSRGTLKTGGVPWAGKAPEKRIEEFQVRQIRQPRPDEPKKIPEKRRPWRGGLR